MSNDYWLRAWCIFSQQQQQQLCMHPELISIYNTKSNNTNEIKCMAARDNHYSLVKLGSHP